MSGTPVVTPKETYFVRDKKRTIATRGFSHDALEEHLRDHIHKPSDWDDEVWCDLKCVTRVFCGRANAGDRTQMRRRLSRAGKEFLDRGLLLLKQTGLYGAILSVKLYDERNPNDVIAARKIYAAELDKGEASDGKLKQIEEIVGPIVTVPIESDTEVPIDETCA